MSDDRRHPASRGWHPSAGSRAARDEAESLAPVIPLFGRERGRSVAPQAEPENAGAARPQAGASSATSAFTTLRALLSTGDAADGPAESTASDDDGGHTSPLAVHDAADDARERGEAVLVRKLRARSLSLTEARAVLRGVEGVDDALMAEIIDHFCDVGYLDDAALAEQLALTAVERKGQGRRAVVQTLIGRGISREVAEGVVAELPDDDEERALEFARSRARAVGGRDRDASLRRLAGQLARRGYSSSVSMRAARRALDDAAPAAFRPSGGSPSGVRFSPDE